MVITLIITFILMAIVTGINLYQIIKRRYLIKKIVEKTIGKINKRNGV